MEPIHQQAGPFRVHPHGVVVIQAGGLEDGEMQDVIESRRQRGEVRIGEVHHRRGNADLLDSLPRSGIAEAGDAPHLVVSCQLLNQRESDLAGRAGHEDLSIGQHGLPPAVDGPTSQLRGVPSGGEPGCDLAAAREPHDSPAVSGLQ